MVHSLLLFPDYLLSSSCSSALGHYLVHQSRLWAWTEKTETGEWSQAGACPPLWSTGRKRHGIAWCPKNFFVKNTYTGRITTKKRRVMVLVLHSAASECALRHISTSHEGTEYHKISFSNLNWRYSCYCTGEMLGFFVVVKYDMIAFEL